MLRRGRTARPAAATTSCCSERPRVSTSSNLFLAVIFEASLHARGFASTGPARKGKDDDDDADAAERRQRAEEAAAKSVNRFSSPLFSHVELEKDDPERTVPRWANVLFVAAVAGVFGYFARYAYTNETRRAERAARESARSGDAREARRGGWRAARREEKASPPAAPTTTVDPFEGLSPEEIEKLAGGEGEGSRVSGGRGGTRA